MKLLSHPPRYPHPVPCSSSSAPLPDSKLGGMPDPSFLHGEPFVFTYFPVLSSTQFCLELMAQGNTFDLRGVIEVLGRDPGAVLRIFAALAREFPHPRDRPERLEDCLVNLPSQELLKAMDHPPSRREEQAALVAFARHGHTIARHAGAAAASLGLREERAFLVGLLHALGTLPWELGRSPVKPEPSHIARSFSCMAPHLHLPPALQAALEAVHRGDPGSLWVALINAAHDLAGISATHSATQAVNLRQRSLS